MRTIHFIALIVLLPLSLFSGEEGKESSLKKSPFADMVYLTDASSARISSWDRTGANSDWREIQPGGTLVLAEIPDAGCIRHLYFSIAPAPGYLRDLVLRIYWDGEEHPSVDVPFGDFFGQGHEWEKYFRSLMITVNEGSLGRAGTLGFNAYFPMPFAKGARLELINQGEYLIPAVWYHVDYEKLEEVDEDAGRFHAQWNQENPTKAVGEWKNVVSHPGTNLDGRENYLILDAEGHGNLAGYFLNIDNFQGVWWGEGDDMIFIDGEVWPPSYHGSGTEEIFGAGACPGIEYEGPYTGFYMLGNPDYYGKVSAYRFFVADPVRFRKSIRMTIEHGHANNMENNYSSTVFWYQKEPHKPFPALPPSAERHPRSSDTEFERAAKVHMEYRQAIADARAFFGGKGLPVPHELEREALNILSIEIFESFEKRDYETAIEKCRAAMKRIGEYKEQYK